MLLRTTDFRVKLLRGKLQYANSFLIMEFFFFFLNPVTSGIGTI